MAPASLLSAYWSCPIAVKARKGTRPNDNLAFQNRHMARCTTAFRHFTALPFDALDQRSLQKTGLNRHRGAPK